MADKKSEGPFARTSHAASKVRYLACSKCRKRLPAGHKEALCSSCAPPSSAECSLRAQELQETAVTDNREDNSPPHTPTTASAQTHIATDVAPPAWATQLSSGIPKLAACLDKLLDRLDQGAVEPKTRAHKCAVPSTSLELSEEESIANSPTADDFSQSEEEISDDLEDNEEPTRSSESIDKLILSVIKCLDPKESELLSDSSQLMFKRQKKSVPIFPSHPQLDNIIQSEWEQPEKRFQANRRFQRLYPFPKENTDKWGSPPSIDAPVSGLSKNTALPVPDASSFKDSMDKKLEGLLRAIFSSSGESLRPIFATAWVSRALQTWISSLMDDILSLVRRLTKTPNTSARFAMRVLGSMVATIEAVPFAQFHLRELQWNILTQWNRTNLSQRIVLLPKTKVSLTWWLNCNNLSKGRNLADPQWQTLTTDASLKGWGAVFGTLTAQGIWSSAETQLPINILELRAVRRALSYWQQIMKGIAIRVQSDNATTVAYLNHQGGTRSRQALQEVSQILSWAEKHNATLSAIYIPGLENWEADYLSRQTLDPGEWSLKQEVFTLITERWGIPEIDLMASRVNRKVQQFMSRCRDPLALAVDAMTAPWEFQLGYAFPPLPLLPRLIGRIQRENHTVILIAQHWPRRAWFSDLINLTREDPLPLPNLPDLLSQGPIVHPNSKMLSLTAWLLRP
ncbi:uncharacterized protein LOC121399363 [Xenopus laevis]|uniref:Uncharacterized protein LOC121399363 n=1 Tax=Xenopus laevis TaxID=8355 RepID=A0A8J1M3F4_XENLA|nr:uncharacterized protein LOC121399363 [Xenopus laevis]